MWRLLCMAVKMRKQLQMYICALLAATEPLFAVTYKILNQRHIKKLIWLNYLVTATTLYNYSKPLQVK